VTTLHWPGETGEHIHFCDFQPVNGLLLYNVEWTLSLGNGTDRLLHNTSFIQYKHIAYFRTHTALLEKHLLEKGVQEMGYTVSNIVMHAN